MDPAWLWLWHRVAATALIPPLAWEPPCAMSVALKREKKKFCFLWPVPQTSFPAAPPTHHSSLSSLPLILQPHPFPLALGSASPHQCPFQPLPLPGSSPSLPAFPAPPGPSLSPCFPLSPILGGRVRWGWWLGCMVVSFRPVPPHELLEGQRHVFLLRTAPSPLMLGPRQMQDWWAVAMATSQGHPEAGIPSCSGPQMLLVLSHFTCSQQV